MTLMISNADVEKVLTMADTIAALEESYQQLITGESVCVPRIDVQIPTSDPKKTYQWGAMKGGSTKGYFAIRMKSDITYEQTYNGVTTREKYSTKPGLFCGLIFLTSTETGEPLAFINDGVLQHKRVGADGGIGVRHMSRENAKVVGMLGSGGMARTHMEAFTCVRKIEKLQVFSPTPANREKFGAEMRKAYGIDVVVCDNPRDVYRGADIVADVTDSVVPALNGDWIEPGTHVTNIGSPMDKRTMERVDVILRFGSAGAPVGLPEFGLADEHLTYAAIPERLKGKAPSKRARGSRLEDRMITLKDIAEGTNRGRSSAQQITFSERGNLQGAQFWAVAGVVYEKAKASGLGREIPTEWLLQDIRD